MEGGESGTGEAVSAPLTGTITKILVKPGEEVQSGQVCILLEAMKMETEVRVPRAGSVMEIPIKVGDPVNAGDPLLILT